MTVDEKIDRIIYIRDMIEPNEITLLTGSNGSGKSLVRKQVSFSLARKIPNVNIEKLTADVSMQRRTESNPEWGALSSINHDLSWNPTSYSTYSLIDTMLNSCLTEDDSKKRYIIIDEPEIGMSRETQLGLVKYLMNRLDEIMSNSHGLLIITHSEVIVDAFKDKSVFLNLDKDCTADEWLHRELIPVDLEQLAKDSHELFLGINERSKKNEG